MPTYILLGSQTLASTATSVTFNSIPATYTDLVLRVSETLNSAGGADDLRIQFNGGYGSGSTTNINATGSSPGSTRTSTPALPILGKSNSTTANTFGSYEIYIPNYATSGDKPFWFYGVSEADSTSNWYIYSTAVIYSTSAVTSLTFVDGGSAMKVGSSFYLYGISNA